MFLQFRENGHRKNRVAYEQEMDLVRDKFAQPEGMPMEEEILLHLHHPRDQKMKHPGREPSAEEGGERVDSISKRGFSVPPNDVITYCAIERSGIRIDLVSLFRNFQGGRGGNLGMTLAELRPSPTKKNARILENGRFHPARCDFRLTCLLGAVALGPPGIPRGSRFLKVLHIVIRHQSTCEEKHFK